MWMVWQRHLDRHLRCIRLTSASGLDWPKRCPRQLTRFELISRLPFGSPWKRSNGQMASLTGHSRNNRHLAGSSMSVMRNSRQSPSTACPLQSSNPETKSIVIPGKTTEQLIVPLCRLDLSTNPRLAAVFRRSLSCNCCAWRDGARPCDRTRDPLVGSGNRLVGSGTVRTVDSIWTAHSVMYMSVHHGSWFPL